MSFVITPADRASFQRCRRQWDFGARARQNLEPLHQPVGPDLERALRDALAVYYYPGMWDWDPGVRLPLVVQGLERALTRQRERSGDAADANTWQQQLDAGRSVLEHYFGWAPGVDQFSPVLAETDYEATVLSPAPVPTGLVTATGEDVRYRGRIDLLAVDRHDAYWIVRHRLVTGDWLSTERLAADQEMVAACWAWEQFYLGLAITGTVFNELRVPPQPAAEPAQGRQQPGERRWRWLRLVEPLPAVSQHEPSGGGRSIPQHRRMYAQARQPDRAEPVRQEITGQFRRTWLRRSPADVARAGQQLGADAAEMIRRDLKLRPSPSGRNCPPCPYLGPCQALFDGKDAGPVLRSGYRERPPDIPEEGRLGGGAWSTGRGAAPPRFRGSQGR